MAVFNLEACRVQKVLRIVRACSHILSHSLKGWLRLRVRTSVTIPRLGIEFDEAVLNLVVLDSVYRKWAMIASRSFRIDFRTNGRPAATRSFRFYLAIIIISAQFHIPWVVRAPISVPNVTRPIFPRESAIRLGTGLFIIILHHSITSLFQTLICQSHFGPSNVNSYHRRYFPREWVGRGWAIIIVESTPVRLYTTIICTYIINIYM